MNKESGQGMGEILALALAILFIGMVFLGSLDQNSNGILDSKENYRLYQE